MYKLKNISLIEKTSSYSINKNGEYTLMNSNLTQKIMSNWFRFSSQIAVTDEENELTYQELSVLVDKAARLLLDNNVNKIALIVERSLELIILVLGAIRAGVTFLLIEPLYPKCKIDNFLKDFCPDLLFLKSTDSMDFNFNVVSWYNYSDFLDVLSNENVSNELSVYDHQNKNNYLAYATFTSGTTGNPKLLHGKDLSLIHFLDWSDNVFNYSEYQNYTCLSGISHDPFLRDILIPLKYGKTIYLSQNLSTLIQNNSLSTWLNERGIEVIHVTAPLLRLINTQAISSHEILPNLKLVLSGGDCLYHSDVSSFRTIAPNTRLFNVYGATETPQIAAYYEVMPGKQISSSCDLLPIGIAAPGFEILLDENNQLIIHSNLLVKEFHKSGIYESGDIGFTDSDGNFICSGRNLNFILHNGYRIDVKEIENIVRKFVPLLSLKLNSFRGQLELFLVLKSDSFQFDDFKLKQFMSEFIPKYSIPQNIYVVGNDELSLNQKIDFEKTRSRYINYSKLENIRCEYIQKISEHLGVSISSNCNFIELGIDSLALAQLSSLLKEEYNVEVTPFDLLLFESISDLIKLIKIKNEDQISSKNLIEKFKEIPSTLSDDQFGLLLENNKSDNGLYNVYTLYEINGDLDLFLLKQNIQKLVRAHDVLRYRIYDDGSFTINDQLIFTSYDLGNFSKRNDGHNKIIEFINRPFNLEQEPALRIGVLNLKNSNQKILIFVLPHLLFDGASQFIFEKNLLELFSKPNHELSVTPPSYIDYLRDLKKNISLNKRVNSQYWEKKLGGFEPLKLPYDHSSLDKLASGECYDFVLSKKIADKIKKLSKENKTTVQSIILTIVFSLLSKYSESGDISLGIVFNGRVDKKYNELLGYAVNTNILRVNATSNDTFLSLLDKVKTELIDCYKHQFFSFIDLKKIIRKSQSHKIIDVMFNYEKVENIDSNLGNSMLRKLPFHNGSAKFPITFYVAETSKEIKIKIEYSIGLFSSNTIKKIFNNFLNIVETVFNDDLNKIPKKNCNSWKDTFFELNQNTSHVYDEQFEYIYSPFLNTAEKYPNKTAVICGDDSCSYYELLTASYKLASYLSRLPVEPNQLIAVYLPKGIEQIVSVLAITMAGAAYLPIASHDAVDRVESILHQGEVKFVLTDNKLSSQINRSKYQILHVRDIINSAEDEVGQLNNIHSSSDLAYVIFTSGSTGVPKGVMIEHKAVLNTLQDVNLRFQINPSDVVYGLSNLNFDLSVYDIFGTFAAGATLILPQEESRKDPSIWVDEIIKHKITIWNSVPALMEMLCNYAQTELYETLDSIRLVLLSGDWIPLQLPTLIKTTCNKLVKVISLGGATEASIWSIFYPISDVSPQWKSIPYGKAMWNQQFHILNEHLEQVAIGDSGDLYISGIGLARGYWNDKQRTEHSFVTHARTGERLYKTGDLGRYHSDGNIEFLGRKDFQIKIRGYRIELGEIENKIEELQHIERAVVIEHGGSLFAYVISKDTLDQNSILSFLRCKLPEYMIPAAIMQLEYFPLTENGKIDRNNLPEIQIIDQDDYESPINSIEATIVKIWETVLGLERISRRANFFELGGHSLQVLEVSLKIREQFGKRVPLKLFFSNPILCQLAEQIAFSQENNSLVVTHYEEQNKYPLTYVQSRLWFLEKFAPNNGAYTITQVYFLKGKFDLNRFESCIDVLANRHPALRTMIIDDGRGYQTVSGKSSVKLQKLDWSGAQYDISQIEKSINEFARKIAVKEYSFHSEQLWRPYLIHLSEQVNIFIINFHHLIADAISLDIYLKELSEEYGRQNDEQETFESSKKYTYGDYSQSLLDINNKNLFNKQIKYWEEKLEGFENYRLDLPSDFVRPSEFSFQGKTISFQINQKLLREIDLFTKRIGCTRSTLFLAVFHILLYRLSGQANILTGQIVANRNHSDLEDVLGYFSNTIVVTSCFNKDYSFTKYIKKLHTDLIDDFSNQEAPFEMLVESLSPLLDRSTSPIFQHMYAYQQVKENLSFDNFETERLNFDSDRSKFDLTLYIEDSINDVLAKFEYYSDLFSERTINKFINTYIYLLSDAVENPNKNINELTLLSDTDIKTIEDWNNTKFVFKDNYSLLFEPFVANATENPDKIAVIADDGKLTYGSLLNCSIGLAKKLRQLDVKANQLVAIYLPKSLCQVVSTLGIMIAGAAYLPISVNEAKDRLENILVQGKVSIIITNSALKNTIDSNKYKVLCLDSADKYSSDDNYQINTINKPSDLAYVIFTSGSTGVPKGVMIEHEAALNTIKDINYKFHVCANDVVYGLSNLNFDLSVYDIFGTFLAGGTLVLPSEENVKEPSAWVCDIQEHSITIWNSVPALLQMLNDFSKNQFEKIIINTIRLVLLSGDWIPLKLPCQFKKLSGENTEIISLGGATEASIWSILYPIEEVLSEWKSIPYGRPMLNQQFYILNESFENVPIGTIGELFIGGVGLARGYFNDEERTKMSFITHHKSGIRLYKTGDLGRYHEDGLIEFMGRKDHQIKIHGFRIELGEIEVQLESMPEVDRAVVIEKNGILYAYLTSLAAMNLDSILNKLQSKLPDYMIPSAIQQISDIPLTANGKVDRNALPNIHKVELVKYEAPLSEIEIQVASIWSRLLKVKNVSRNDNFFRLGGHSLIALELINKIRSSLGISISLRSLFQTQSLSAFCAAIEESIQISKSSQKSADNTSKFFIDEGVL